MKFSWLQCVAIFVHQHFHESIPLQWTEMNAQSFVILLQNVAITWILYSERWKYKWFLLSILKFTCFSYIIYLFFYSLSAYVKVFGLCSHSNWLIRSIEWERQKDFFIDTKTDHLDWLNDLHFFVIFSSCFFLFLFTFCIAKIWELLRNPSFTYCSNPFFRTISGRT